MSQFYQAKKVGTSASGSHYSVLQDGPASFHISVQYKDRIRYDYIQNPKSMEEIDNTINELEQELLNDFVIPLTSGEIDVKLEVSPPDITI